MQTSLSDVSMPVAVVGAGKMGENHVRAYGQLKGAGSVYVYDADHQRAIEVARRHDAIAVERLEDLVGKVKAATVAVPSSLHGAVGTFLLDNGIHCLIEKPLAPTQADCEALLAAAAANNVTLMVGHIERFNPAVTQLSRLLGLGAPLKAIEARRMSYASARITDVDVVMDLLIHDLDIVCWLVGDKVVDVSAAAVPEPGTAHAGFVSTLLTFANGAVANLTASRITHNKIRELSVATDESYAMLDYINQTLSVCRGGQAIQYGELSPLRDNFVLDLAIEQVLVRRSEPLMMELAHFLECVGTGKRPLINGEDAYDVLKLAWRIQDQIKA